MSKAESIRAYLREHGAVSEETGITRQKIREALGMSKNRIGSSLSDLKAAGFIRASGHLTGKVYWSTGRELPPALTEEECRLRDNARHEERRRGLGKVPRAEYLAACAARRAEKVKADAAARKARKDRKKVEREQKAMARAQAIVARMKGNSQAKAMRRSAALHPTIAPAVAREELPSVEEWLAKGGVIERPGPKPFQRIKPEAVKCRPLVMPMRVMGRAA